MLKPDFEIGDRVVKHSGTYGGPGIVRGYAIGADGHYRYNVAHRIDGGFGELLHIYMAKDIKADPLPPA